MIAEQDRLLTQKTRAMTVLGLIIANNNSDNVDLIDFSGLAEASRSEENVLPTTEESLRKSFQTGMSAVFLNEEQRAVGHARFIPLLDEKLRDGLNLSTQVPQIWEMGTGLMLDECRGKGINILLRHGLVRRYRAQMASGEVLVIATTKTPELRRLVDNLADLTTDEGDAYPLDFRFTNRENIPFIAPFTCVCNPEFGTGYQHGTACNQAEGPSGQTSEFRRGIELPVIGSTEPQKIACTVFVSSTSLARTTSELLQNQFGSRQNLVNKLIERGYFND